MNTTGHRLGWSATALALWLSFNVRAQEAVSAPAPEPAADDAVQLDKVEVTGSRIRRTDYETASPIQVVNRADIERSGKQNIAEVIRGISADNQGSIPGAFTAGFAAGSAAVSLRGLGVNSTLVLINGRRMATYGLADDGQRNFVDLNSIPLEAVDRIEVLKDGASAIYGSDAIGGVVNILLRTDYRGASLGGNFGTSYMDDGDTSRLYGSYGFGNDRYSAFFTLEGTTQDAISQRNRPDYLGTTNLTRFGFFDNRQGAPAAGFGNFTYFAVDDPDHENPLFTPAFSAVTPYGSVRVPGDPNPGHRINLTACPEVHGVTGMCTFDMIDYAQVQPKQDRLNLLSRGTVELGSGMQAYAEFGYFYSKVEAIGTPGGVNDNGVYNAADPANPIRHTTILPADHPDNHAGVASTLSLLMTDLGGRNGTQESNVFRLITGLKGNLATWDWDVGAGYIRSELDDTNTGFVRHSVLQRALNDGTYRINNPGAVPQSLRDEISPDLKRTATSSITLVDAKLSGSLFDLPGGPFGIAFGTEFRNEKTDTPPVPYTDTGEIVGLGYSAFEADRDVYAGYVEISAPVLSFLELNGALRYDHYSDYGHSTTPKVGFKLKPIEQVAFRATYAEAFRAPGPAESGNSSTFGFTNIGLLTIGNPDIKPEEAKSYTAGIVAEPVHGTSIAVDYYRIERDNEIIGADQASVIGDNPVSGEDPFAVRPGALPNSFLYYDQDGDLGTISAPYINANKTTTSGFDIDLRQKLSLHEFGTVTAALVFTHVISFERELADGSTFEYAGTHGPYALSSAGGTPKDRARLDLTWEKGPVTISGAVNYVSGMDLIDHEGEELIDLEDGTYATSTFEGAYYVLNPNGQVCGVYNPDGTVFNDCHLASFTTFDLFGKWEAEKNWEVTGSVQNLFNRMAPFDPYTYGGVNYNPAFHQSGAVGRFMTIGVKYTF